MIYADWSDLVPHTHTKGKIDSPVSPGREWLFLYYFFFYDVSWKHESKKCGSTTEDQQIVVEPPHCIVSMVSSTVGLGTNHSMHMFGFTPNFSTHGPSVTCV